MIPYFTVVIPTHQHPALLLKCLDALGRQTLPRAQFEVVVVDDGNTPETAMAVALFTRQVARSGGPLEVRYLGQPERRGSAAARNRGWRAARGSVVAFTDDDCLPEANWLAAALTSFQRGAQVMTGALRLTLPDSRTQYDPKSLNIDLGELSSANCFCRPSALERVGGFEEAFDSSWHEGNDLRFRFIRAGVPIGKCPEAIVVHPLRETPWYTPLTDERKRYYDALLYKRHPALFRQRIATDRTLIVQHCASVGGVLVGVLGGLTRQPVLTTAGFGLWGVLSADLIHRRLSGDAAGAGFRQTVLMPLATPFLSVYWRLYGALKYRVLYW